MTANMIINFFENYGLIMTILATSGIVLVGILKAIGLFSKLNPKVKKYVYFTCSCVASIISCTIYLYIKDAFVWADWGMTIVCVIGYTISIYGLYENTGIRSFFKKILFTPIKNLLKRIPSALMSKSMSEEKILSIVKSLGSDILLQLANEAQQKEVKNNAAKTVASEIVASEDAQQTAAIPVDIQNKTASDDMLVKNNFFS